MQGENDEPESRGAGDGQRKRPALPRRARTQREKPCIGMGRSENRVWRVSIPGWGCFLPVDPLAHLAQDRRSRHVLQLAVAWRRR